jgi:hypothetical protein
LPRIHWRRIRRTYSWTRLSNWPKYSLNGG